GRRDARELRSGAPRITPGADRSAPRRITERVLSASCASTRAPTRQADTRRLAACETVHDAAYHGNLHVDDVRRTLVPGATGRASRSWPPASSRMPTSTTNEEACARRGWMRAGHCAVTRAPHRAGGTPSTRVNMRVMWLWSQNPA